jgi:hypothetical protein
MAQEMTGPVHLVIEKSPPNLVRCESLLEHFPKHELLVFNRNPYAYCASILYRQHQPESKSESMRSEILALMAKEWLSRSSYARDIAMRQGSICFTYEQLCSNPQQLLRDLADRVPLLRGIRHDIEIKVKDYPPQRIRNFNPDQIKKLSRPEKDSIQNVLSENKLLLDFFGYSTDWSLG